MRQLATLCNCAWSSRDTGSLLPAKGWKHGANLAGSKRKGVDAGVRGVFPQRSSFENVSDVREGSGETPQWQWQRSKNEQEGLFLAPSWSSGRCHAVEQREGGLPGYLPVVANTYRREASILPVGSPPKMEFLLTSVLWTPCD